MGPSRIFQKNKTTTVFHRVCKIIYLCCGTNFWFQDLNFPTAFVKIFNPILKIRGFISFVFVVTGWGPFYTQKNLTEEHTNYALMFASSHTIIYFVFASVVHYRELLGELVFTLSVKLKGMYNNEQIERMMSRSAFWYLAAYWFVCSFTLISHGIGSGVQALTSNATFTTVIPIWPDVEDRRLAAGVVRILSYIAWCNFIAQVTSIYYIVLTVAICVSHQFKILCDYFESLNDIFEGDGSQTDKEKEYEDAFKLGIKMHSLTLWCTKQTQVTGGIAFSGQVLINVSVLVLMMMQMMYTERTLVAVMPVLFMASSVLVGSGVFMWNAGDITIEASRLPNAMFFSGWHNCQKSSVGIRKMVTIAMTQAQQRVVINGFGFIELSYESYVTIVKSSYSLFSVMY